MSNFSSRRLAATIVGLLVGCGPSLGGELAPPEASTASSPPVLQSPANSTPSADLPQARSASAATQQGSESFACGALRCRRFASAGDALKHVLETDRPEVLAFGESHAQKGAPAVKSATARTSEELLPLLKGKATSMVVELWLADPKCAKEQTEKVITAQKPVVQNQAATNKNEFVVLGETSKSLGITPYPLRPTCDEQARVANAGDDAVLEMLTLVTTTMRAKLLRELTERRPEHADAMVLAYGGALHNDLQPKAGRENWSFAGALAERARYVELDLVVPEYIRPDSEAWRGLPWFDAYASLRAENDGGDASVKRTLLIEIAPRSYALLFEPTRAP